MISNSDVKNWQSIWSMILNMTYYGIDIVHSLDVVPPYDKSWKDQPNFEEVTFEYMWKKYSQLKDENGNYLEPKPVPQLKNISVSRFLFECLGSSIFLKYCFPICQVTYLEDSV